jgi:hypothetical protein
MKLKKWFESEDGDSKYEEEEGVTADMKTARRRMERTRFRRKKKEEKKECTSRTRASINARTKIFSLTLRLNPPQPQLQTSKNVSEPQSSSTTFHLQQ